MSLFYEIPKPDEPEVENLSTSVLPEHLQYIVIECVIGVGKTSLTKLLAQQSDARLVLEQFE